MIHYVHSSLIYISQKLERAQMSFNREMDTEIVVYIHNGVILIQTTTVMEFITATKSKLGQFG